MCAAVSTSSNEPQSTCRCCVCAIIPPISCRLSCLQTGHADAQSSALYASLPRPRSLPPSLCHPLSPSPPSTHTRTRTHAHAYVTHTHATCTLMRGTFPLCPTAHVVTIICLHSQELHGTDLERVQGLVLRMRLEPSRLHCICFVCRSGYSFQARVLHAFVSTATLSAE